MPRVAYEFTKETLRRLQAMKAEDPGLTKRDACNRLRVSLITLNRAADRAGLRKQLTALFPPNNSQEPAKYRLRHTGIRHLTPEQIDTPLQVSMLEPSVRWLTGNWRASV